MNLKHDLSIAPLVAAALRDGRGVVALESTTLMHSVPLSARSAFAAALCNAVREAGAVPAITAVYQGALCIGMAEDTLAAFCAQPEVAKISRRDLPIFVATRGTGATTAAATLILASIAGIPVFSAAGIGGALSQQSGGQDVSADLQELRQSPVCAVCSGIKAFGEPCATLEYLETMGVPVLGLRTEKFPGFFALDTAYPVDYTVQTEAEIARIAKTKWNLGLKGGVLAAVSAGLDEKAAAEFAAWGSECAEAALSQNVRGKQLTPFYFDTMAQRSGGASTQLLMQLCVQNARVAGKIAEAYATK